MLEEVKVDVVWFFLCRLSVFLFFFRDMVFNGNGIGSGYEVYDFEFMSIVVLNGFFKINIKFVEMCKDDIIVFVKVMNIE